MTQHSGTRIGFASFPNLRDRDRAQHAPLQHARSSRRCLRLSNLILQFFLDLLRSMMASCAWFTRTDTLRCISIRDLSRFLLSIDETTSEHRFNTMLIVVLEGAPFVSVHSPRRVPIETPSSFSPILKIFSRSFRESIRFEEG
jgi:hypothetical protein